MKNLSNNSQIIPVKLDKNTKTQIWAFVVPLIMAANCIFLRVFLEAEAEKRCRVYGEGISFDACSYGSPNFFELLLFSDIDCADPISQFLYKFSGFLIFISAGLSITLPLLLHLRHQPIKQTKLFE